MNRLPVVDPRHDFDELKGGKPPSASWLDQELATLISTQDDLWEREQSMRASIRRTHVVTWAIIGIGIVGVGVVVALVWAAYAGLFPHTEALSRSSIADEASIVITAIVVVAGCLALLAFHRLRIEQGEWNEQQRQIRGVEQHLRHTLLSRDR